MGFIDVIVPGAIGLLAVLWPQVVFLVSRSAPDPVKIRTIRIFGLGAIVFAVLFLAVKLAVG